MKKGVKKIQTERPIIGVLTQPFEEEEGDWRNKFTFIEHAYIQFIESVGGRTVPIHYNDPFDRVAEVMDQVNGILFTGGDLNLTNPKTGEYHVYSKLAKFIYERAKQINDNGVVYPIWGTCQGHQLMMMLESEDKTIIKPSPRWYLADNITLTYTKSSKMFEFFPQDLLDKLENELVVFNIHNYGIYLHDFVNSERLSKTYDLLATNIDDNGVEYIAITGKFYPKTR